MLRKGHIVECIRDFIWNGEVIVREKTVHRVLLATTICHGQLLDIGIVRNEPVICRCSCGKTYKDKGMILIPHEHFKKIDDPLFRQMGKLENGFRRMQEKEFETIRNKKA